MLWVAKLSSFLGGGKKQTKASNGARFIHLDLFESMREFTKNVEHGCVSYSKHLVVQNGMIYKWIKWYIKHICIYIYIWQLQPASEQLLRFIFHPSMERESPLMLVHPANTIHGRGGSMQCPKAHLGISRFQQAKTQPTDVVSICRSGWWRWETVSACHRCLAMGAFRYVLLCGKWRP